MRCFSSRKLKKRKDRSGLYLVPTMLTRVLRFHLVMYSVAAIAEIMITRAINSSGENKGMTLPPVTTGVSSIPVGVCTVTCGALD